MNKGVRIRKDTGEEGDQYARYIVILPVQRSKRFYRAADKNTNKLPEQSGRL
jgi:hypothetical protein